MNALFGTDTLFDPEDFFKLLARLGLDLTLMALVVGVVYWRLYRRREMVFTYVALNVISFSICALLRKTPMDMGFALGLFGIFGILRYRTAPIHTRDLTYLFVVLGVAIINAVANKKISLSELLFVNGLIAAVTMAIELPGASRRSIAIPLLYDRLELLRPERASALLADLCERTGLDVVDVEVLQIDMLRDTAELTIHHRPSRERGR